MTVSIKVGAEVDAAALQQQLAEITRRINEWGASLARLGRTRFTPIDRASLDQARQMEQTLRNIARLAPEFARRIHASGQAGTPLDQLDLARMYADPAQQWRTASRIFRLATGLGFSPTGPGFTPPTTDVANAGPFRAPWLNGPLAATGPIGSATARGIGAFNAAGGGLPGLGAGVMAGVGFLAVQGISALIGAVRQEVSAAQAESIGYADLYRRTGGLGSGNSHAGLRARIRGASNRIAVSYDEALNLATLAARRGNISDQADLAAMVEQGGGFARAFGFGPETGVAAFAGLRGINALRSPDEARRLGLAIAEGIARAGVFARAEDYLAEIAAYGETTARETLTRPPLEAFNNALSALLRMGLPGLDPHGAASLLGRADQAIRRGGAAGEAGEAFMLQAIGRTLGLDPLQTELLYQGGAFATGRNTFGPGTIVADFYSRNGLAIPEMAAVDDRTAFELVTNHLRRTYTGGNRRLLAQATGNLFGLNQRQAMALLNLQPEELRGLGALVPDEALADLSPTGIQTLARIATGDRATVERIADEYAARTGPQALTAEERERLRRAQQGGDLAELRAVVAEIARSREAQETEGDRTRRTLQDIDKTIRDMATMLVTPLNIARDALLFLAGRQGAGTPRAVAAAARDAEIAEANAEHRTAIEALGRDHTDATNALRAARRSGDPAAIAAAEATLADIEARIERAHEAREAALEAARARYRDATQTASAGTPRLGGDVMGRAQAFADTLEAAGQGAITRNMALGLAANAIGESAVNPAAIGDNGASRGILQWDATRRANFQRLFGKPVEEATAEEQARFAAWELTSRDGTNTERGTLDRIRAWIADNNLPDTPETWAEGLTRFYERPAHPDSDSAIRRRYATALAAAPRPTGTMPTGPVPEDDAAILPALRPPPRPSPLASAPGAPILLPPMPDGAPPNAVRDAAGSPAGPTAPARVEGEARVTIEIEHPDGWRASPPPTVVAPLRPARPFGATR